MTTASTPAFDPVALHAAQREPLKWSLLLIQLAEQDPAAARLEADKVRVKEIDNGFIRSKLCQVATDTVHQIDYMTGTNPDTPLGGPVRSSASFYRRAQNQPG